jgi:hypothetical protein
MNTSNELEVIKLDGIYNTEQYLIPLAVAKTSVGNFYLAKNVSLFNYRQEITVSDYLFGYERNHLRHFYCFSDSREMNNYFLPNGFFDIDITAVRIKNIMNEPVICYLKKVNDWRARECYKIALGEYTPINPNYFKYIPQHFPHIVVYEKNLYVSYFINEKYGESNRRAVTRLGKYLRSLNMYSNEEIKDIVEKMKIKYIDFHDCELKFTSNKDKIRQIFETRMMAEDSDRVSCMYNKFNHWKVRPYDIYADNPTMEVAYMERKGKIIARSVINSLSRGYVRPYAIKEDNKMIIHKFIELLSDNKYNKTSLEGCCFTANYNQALELVAPYIDGKAQKGVLLPDRKIRIVHNNSKKWDFEFDNTEGVAFDNDENEEIE